MFDLAFSAVLMRWLTKKLLFVTIHTYFRHPSPFYNLFFLPVDRIVLKNLVIRRADCVVCPDYNVREYVGEVFGDVNSALIPYGITLPENESELTETLRDKYGLQGKRVILSLGHVHALRTRKDLVEAMPYILKEFPSAVLLIVGTVSSEIPSSLAEKLNIRDSVVFAGPVSHFHIPAFLELCDLEAHWLNEKEPSKTSLGIASLETMLAGKVVLAAANPETYGPGILKSGENIIMVEPDQPALLAQTIIALLKDARRCQEIGRTAKQTIVEHFSWDSICTQTVEAYRKALK
jgi:glycosyltransferase involved in cell wall biosynthesis